MRVAVKPHVDFAKHCLSHTNPSVRKACVDFVCILYRGVGAKLKTSFAKEKQTTVDILEKEFASITGEPLPAPTRFERGNGEWGKEDPGDIMIWVRVSLGGGIISIYP